jgi:hypothetical protein
MKGVAMAGQKPSKQDTKKGASTGLLFDAQSLKSLLNIPQSGAPGEKKV